VLQLIRREFDERISEFPLPLIGGVKVERLQDPHGCSRS
jgi:hypothetical protein